MKRCVLLCWLILAAFAASAACGDGGRTGQTPSAAGPSATAATSAAASPAAATPGASAAPLNPSIVDALSCRVPPVSKTVPNEGQLQVERIDLKLYPLALCNDASPGIISFRPYQGEENRNKWVVTLSGGGACASGQSCADRWCGVGTNFDADNMSSASGAGGGTAEGLLKRGAGNPFGNWNHVVIRYCSSDTWEGKHLNATLKAKDPKTGKDITYQVHFAGAYIYEAGVSILRKESGQTLVYTRGNGRTEMPDLDDAEEVVFGGGSAGGAGVINNLDRFANTLRAGKNKPVVLGFIEAIVGPSSDTMHYELSTACKEAGACTYDAYYKARAGAIASAWANWLDESCLQWHQKNQPGTEWQCGDGDHVLTQHITTPYFIRMNLGDVLVSSNDIEAGFAGADGKLFTRTTWSVALQQTLLNLQKNVAAGHEKSAMTKAPGVFAPACTRHYTIFDNDATYGDTATLGGKQYTLMDVMANWLAGKEPGVVVSANPAPGTCPGDK